MILHDRKRMLFLDAIQKALDKDISDQQLSAIRQVVEEFIDFDEHEYLPAGVKAMQFQKKFEESAISHLRFEEGVRYKAYKDHLGYLTIGVGRLIDARRGGGFSAEEESQLLLNDPTRKNNAYSCWVLNDSEVNLLLINDIRRFVNAMENWRAWVNVQGDIPRMVALLSMCFQMGPSGLSKFKNSLRLIEIGEYGRAKNNLLKSKWAQQTPARARRVASMIATGILSA